RDLVAMSIGLVIGVLAQVLLGGLVVLTGLNPFSNIAHFLVSMLLMSNAYMLLQHARIFRPQEIVLPRREPEITNSKNLLLARIVLVMTGVAVVTGTVVTGSGPHAGDEHAIRINLAINLAAKIHSITVIMCLVTALALLLTCRRDPISWRILAHPLERFLGVGLLQGLIGYVQYFSGLPVLLVAIHVALSVAVWLGALDLYWNSKLPKAV
ncbi:MAG: heme A synthase, partial [Actinobacteria bacterium]|nr:heme A synthase [Actinomycetota bacterium]